ncbi:hypothetical protein G7046_g6304 [Stylonectria norvegica]|nr:hypothetical protein G7046_g6304 [Stylonectria norvegica]
MSTKPSRVIVIGAGPAGLAAALSLCQQSSRDLPIQVTVLELRETVQTLGGTVNLTPLALRYLDALGVARKVRSLAASVNGIDIVSHRTGGLLGTLWRGHDAVRVPRQGLVEALVERAKELPEDHIKVIFGVTIHKIDELGSANGEGCIKVVFRRSGDHEDTTLEADVLLGCDGLHSTVRTQVVDPARKKTYSGKCNAYGYADLANQDPSTWRRSDGHPLITDTTLVCTWRP